MIEKQLLLIDLQEQLKAAQNDLTKAVLQHIIADVLSDKYNVRTW